MMKWPPSTAVSIRLPFEWKKKKTLDSSGPCLREDLCHYPISRNTSEELSF
jgi:hypothetical protein